MQRIAVRLGYGMTNYRHPLAQEKWRAVVSVPIHTATTPLECAEIFEAVRSCEKIDGDMAEAGVYLGGTAALMLTASSAKRIHLFDTFDGLPGTEGRFEKGDWSAGVEQVRRNLDRWSDRIEFRPGFFPQSAAGAEHLRFSFVHLDLDLYQSTIDALRWFWPRMNPGAALLSHDYFTSPGVVRAFEEFFSDRPEAFLPLSGRQCIAFRNGHP
jgi:hypothetical protein